MDQGIDMARVEQTRMTMGMRIAAAVVGSILGIWSWNMYAEYRARVQLQAYSDSLQRDVSVASANYAAASAAHQREQQRQADAQRSRFVLQYGQRCVGGTVINVSGSSYTQILGSAGRPVACSAGIASEPLR